MPTLLAACIVSERSRLLLQASRAPYEHFVQVIFNVHGSHAEAGRNPPGEPATVENQADSPRASLLRRGFNVGFKFQEPLLTELALVVHAALEAAVLGLEVCYMAQTALVCAMDVATWPAHASVSASQLPPHQGGAYVLHLALQNHRQCRAHPAELTSMHLHRTSACAAASLCNRSVHTKQLKPLHHGGAPLQHACEMLSHLSAHAATEHQHSRLPPLSQTHRTDALILFAAIASHKWLAAMSISTRFLRAGTGRLQLFLLLLPFHIIPPLAIVIAAAVRAESAVAALVLSGLATGTFIYIGAFEVICEEFSGAHAHGAPASEAALKSTEAGAAAQSRVHGHSAHECSAGGGSAVDATARGYISSTPAQAAGTEQRVWLPGQRVKFTAYCAGVGLFLGITAALPAHEH